MLADGSAGRLPGRDPRRRQQLHRQHARGRRRSGEGRPHRRFCIFEESKQGKSFALNCALAHARGEILALTDDDVLPAPDWLARIVADFREHDVTFVFGKVLPRWGAMPPPELLGRRAQDIWGPLAIVDYGDTPQVYSPDCTGQRLPIGANVAFAAARHQNGRRLAHGSRQGQQHAHLRRRSRDLHAPPAIAALCRASTIRR